MLAAMLGVGLGTASASVVAQTAAVMPLILEAKIPLGQVSGRIDHLGIDVKRRRLLVAELGNNSLGVVDLTAAASVRVSPPKNVISIAWRSFGVSAASAARSHSPWSLSASTSCGSAATSAAY